MFLERVGIIKWIHVIFYIHFNSVNDSFQKGLICRTPILLGMEAFGKRIITIVALFLLVALIFLGIFSVTILLLDNGTEDHSIRFLDIFDDEPIQNVTVTIFKRSYEDGYYIPFLGNDMIPYEQKLLKTVHSDRHGWVNFTVPKMKEGRGYYYARIEKTGYISTTGHSIFCGGIAKDHWTTRDGSRTYYFHSSSYMTGTVSFSNGEPVNGISVTVRHSNLEVDNFDITDGSGGFGLENIRSGVVNLTVSGSGIETKNISTFLDKFSGKELDIFVNRTSTPSFNITIVPDTQYNGKPVFLSDHQMVLFLMKTDEEKDTDYCRGASYSQEWNLQSEDTKW